MKVYIKSGRILATHRNDQDLDDKYDFDRMVYVPDDTAIDHEGPASQLDHYILPDKDKILIVQKIIKEMPHFAMLMIHLVRVLMSKRIVAPSDFSEADREEYQKIEAWVDSIC